MEESTFDMMTKARDNDNDQNKINIQQLYKKLKLPVEKAPKINIGKNRLPVFRNRNFIGGQVASRPFLRNFYMS